MKFSVTLSSVAWDELGNLDLTIRRRILEKLETASSNPDHFFIRLSNSSLSKMRVGDCRVIAFIDRGNNAIMVSRIGHRRSVYKK